VTEDNRVARADGEPSKHGPAGAPRWSAYLDWARQEIVDGVLSLSEEERRTTRLPSGWTPIELLTHVIHMEQRWLHWRFLGLAIEQPYGDWHDGDHESRWEVADDVTAEQLAVRLREVGALTSQLLREHDLGDHVAAYNGAEHPDLDLRWICFHVLQEYARHAGHLDIVVELSG
jgi:uncharacterized damage-inducible protein DinB